MFKFLGLDKTVSIVSGIFLLNKFVNNYWRLLFSSLWLYMMYGRKATPFGRPTKVILVYEDLKNHLLSFMFTLEGDWVQKKDQYEQFICDALLMQVDQGRYWDARWGNYVIEFKKGKSIWLDLVRYSEILLNHNESADIPVVNLFFIPNKEKTFIEEIICVETNKIISFLNLNIVFAQQLIELNSKVPRSLNAQASLTVRDLRNISEFIIYQ
jgi:hypothetical protein